MSQAANVHAIEALSELQNALNRYQNEAHEALLAIEIEILRTQEWLREQLRDWQKELRLREDHLKQAQQAVSVCQAQARRDPETGRVYVPDCSRQIAEARRARQRVDEAVAELQTVQQQLKSVENAVSAYHTQANRLKGSLQSDLNKGTALLARSKGILDSYIGGAAIGGGVASSVVAQNTGNSPSSSMTSGSPIAGTGLHMIAVADIDLSDSYVTGAEDFKKKVSPEQMGEGFHKLQSVILPALMRGEGPDYFDQLDAAEGLENANTYSNMYDVYFSPNTCIHLDNRNGKLKVLNGFHRLFVAQQLGITHVPALVDSFKP